MKAIYLILFVLLTTFCQAQLIENKSISLEAAKLIVLESVKFAKEKMHPGVP